MSSRPTIWLIRCRWGADATHFEQLKAQCLDPGKHTEEGRLVEGPAEQRLAIPLCGIEIRKAGEQRLAQEPADVDLATHGLC